MSTVAADSPARLRADAGSPLHVLAFDEVPYRAAWELQHRLVAGRREGRYGDTVVLLEHPPVYTLGRRATPSNILLDDAQLAAAGIDVVPVDRGGDVTYHGPGQLVVYPIFRLAGQRHVVDFVRALEGIAMDALAGLGVEGSRREGLSGVWVGREKIVAIGVRVAAGGITSHGLALNVAPDLTHFGGIIPCGLATEGVTSLQALGHTHPMQRVRQALRKALEHAFAVPLIDQHEEGQALLESVMTEAQSR